MDTDLISFFETRAQATARVPSPASWQDASAYEWPDISEVLNHDELYRALDDPSFELHPRHWRSFDIKRKVRDEDDAYNETHLLLYRPNEEAPSADELDPLPDPEQWPDPDQLNQWDWDLARVGYGHSHGMEHHEAASLIDSMGVWIRWKDGWMFLQWGAYVGNVVTGLRFPLHHTTSGETHWWAIEDIEQSFEAWTMQVTLEQSNWRPDHWTNLQTKLAEVDLSQPSQSSQYRMPQWGLLWSEWEDDDYKSENRPHAVLIHTDTITSLEPSDIDYMTFPRQNEDDDLTDGWAWYDRVSDQLDDEARQRWLRWVMCTDH